ncbi:salivary glue protein Sgs-3-like [Culex pipiens pallens]|uniref:salivary glue protein Sgs-3-like n=1 Tax=Culex pipiens pallens TaxID=42434 RepID=UPI0019548DD8|nr:salivary glue protein Sgs-3-like [Culex pipiens pallens]
MKFLVFILMALASTLTVSCLQCYDCGSPIADLLSAVKCLNRNSTCEGGNTTCISRTLIDETNQTLIARGCAPAEWCANLPMNNSGSCIECNTDNCNGDGSTVPSTTTTTTRPPTTTTTDKPAVTTTSPKVQPSVGTTTSVKPAVETTTIPKAQPTKTKNSASSAGGSLAVMLVVAVVLQFKLN